MAYEYILVSREGPVTVVTLNRPEVFNALHKPAHMELEKAFDEFSADPDQWVAIVTGAGDKAFSAGNDLKYQAAGGERGWGRSGFGGLVSRFDCDKPIIAAVNGFAMGGGFEVALACDIIVAAENAIFALPEPSVGLAAMAGGLLRLPRTIGMKRAMGMILTARRVSPQEGVALGFVHEVTPVGEVMHAARTIANHICTLSPMSIRASKQVAMRGAELSLADALVAQNDFPAVKAMFGSADLIEGPKAFAEKRKPKWTGR
ncbi:MAG: enoyl-CoA hydratase-related protein [Rhodoblastus sp.]